MYGLVMLVYIYCLYFLKKERNNFLLNILWKFILEKKGWSCVVNFVIVFVFMVLLDRIEILISIKLFD